MPVNLTGPRQAPAKPAPGFWSAFGTNAPQAGFFAVVVLGFAFWIATRTALPDLSMPLVASIFLCGAALFGALAWWRGAMDPSRVTFRDVAGALTLIGVCAAAAIDSEQIIRIVQANSSSE